MIQTRFIAYEALRQLYWRDQLARLEEGMSAKFSGHWMLNEVRVLNFCWSCDPANRSETSLMEVLFLSMSTNHDRIQIHMI